MLRILLSEIPLRQEPLGICGKEILVEWHAILFCSGVRVYSMGIPTHGNDFLPNDTCGKTNQIAAQQMACLASLHGL